MTTETLFAHFDAEALQRWTPTTSFSVEPGHCRAYAAATNESYPDRFASRVAPPLLLVAATVPHVHQIFAANLSEQILAENRSVHGEHDVRYHEPAVPGTTLLVRGRIHGVVPKSSGTALVSVVELRDPDDGRLVQEQYFVNFLRGVQTDATIGTPAAPHRLPDGLGSPAHQETYTIDADQTYRYAEASGDHSVYHLDDGAARAAGFQSIIVHGLCTMAFASRAVVADACGADATRLRRLAVRFSRPMYPGHAMTTSLWPDRDRAGHWHFAVTDDSEPEPMTVITDGLAEVAPAGEDGFAT